MNTIVLLLFFNHSNKIQVICFTLKVFKIFKRIWYIRL